MNAAPNYLPAGLDAPYHEALLSGNLLIQRFTACRGWQWGPEWICHRCLSFDLDWDETEAAGRIFSWERVWHPVHPALAQHGPYLVVLVELPQADHVRLVGNLLGDPHQPVPIAAPSKAFSNITPTVSRRTHCCNGSSPVS